ncbi:MAG: virulence RhuM family protein [Bacteroidales bacterium]|nr:virulence RhuM family protein [Bacteroidales bacterium]
MNTNQNEIILYQPDNSVELEVLLENETVWLTQAQMGMLFGRDRTVIGRHIRNIFTEGELQENVVCANFAHTTQHGAIKDRTQTIDIQYYNLDVIISVGYRVKSRQGTIFRQWANSVLKEYILRGYAISQRFERLEYRVAETEKKIDFFVKTALPPAQGIFYNGQIFDAYVFVSDLIKSAKKSIILLDNYINESVLLLLSKRSSKIIAKIYTKQISPQLQLDLTKHNAQYEPVNIYESDLFHDRFLLIDDTVYHLGASLKDLGKRLFAFSKMEVTAADILRNVNNALIEKR